jgi:hypothetical protein
MFLTAILHHALFWGFSNEHDHAAIKGLYPMVVITSIFLTQLNKKKLVIALSLMVVFNIAQYFFLHNCPIRKGIYSNANYCNEIEKSLKNTTTMDDGICKYPIINTICKLSFMLKNIIYWLVLLKKPNKNLLNLVLANKHALLN